MQFWAPDDGRKNGMKHVQRLTEIKKSVSVLRIKFHVSAADEAVFNLNVHCGARISLLDKM